MMRPLVGRNPAQVPSGDTARPSMRAIGASAVRSPPVGAEGGTPTAPVVHGALADGAAGGCGQAAWNIASSAQTAEAAASLTPRTPRPEVEFISSTRYARPRRAASRACE